MGISSLVLHACQVTMQEQKEHNDAHLEQADIIRHGTAQAQRTCVCTHKPVTSTLLPILHSAASAMTVQVTYAYGVTRHVQGTSTAVISWQLEPYIAETEAPTF